METILTYTEKGGFIFVFLLTLSLITLTLIIYKFLDIYFFRNLNFSKSSESFNYQHSSSSLESIKNEFEEKMFGTKKFILLDLINIFQSGKSENIINHEVNIIAEKEFKKLYSFLPSLEVISQVSPLIGLLGTVIGMIDSFNELEIGGSLVDPSILAGGIWTALLTTAMGLIVAIPALVSHYFLEKKIQSYVESFDLILMKLSTIK